MSIPTRREFLQAAAGATAGFAAGFTLGSVAIAAGKASAPLPAYEINKDGTLGAVYGWRPLAPAFRRNDRVRLKGAPDLPDGATGVIVQDIGLGHTGADVVFDDLHDRVRWHIPFQWLEKV